VFADAQAKIAADDLAAAFGCFDRADVSKIADNSIRALSTADPDFAELGDRFGYSPAHELRGLADRLAASAALLTEDRASYDPNAHRQLVKDYQAATKNGLESADDLAAFTAAMEDRMRIVMGGGSISPSLFRGETVVDVEVDGKRAWATRVDGGSEVDDIGFVLKRDGWKIKLFARRPNR
jgi:hypothetical protein